MLGAEDAVEELQDYGSVKWAGCDSYLRGPRARPKLRPTVAPPHPQGWEGAISFPGLMSCRCIFQTAMLVAASLSCKDIDIAVHSRPNTTDEVPHSMRAAAAPIGVFAV
jgi:hypothetical protein